MGFTYPVTTVYGYGSNLGDCLVGFIQGHTLMEMQPPCNRQYAPFHTHVTVDYNLSVTAREHPFDETGYKVNCLPLVFYELHRVLTIPAIPCLSIGI